MKKTDVGFPKNKCRDLFDQLVALLVLTCRQISCRGILLPNKKKKYHPNPRHAQNRPIPKDHNSTNI
jgi:hypothetical protein